jgi:glycosyltransferase involved in cell wall biosynthesis
MYKSKKISAVIPCYNEEKTIGVILRSMPDFVDEIIVVDNNSTDKTKEMALKYGAKVIKEGKQGVGWAMRKGFENSKGDIIVVIDGDGQHNPEDIDRFSQLLVDKKDNVIFGTRFFEKRLRSESGSILRDVGNKLQTTVFNILFRSDITDSQCGMWIFKKSVLEKISLISSGFSIVEEFRARIINKNIKFSELSISCYKRQGRSRLSPFKDGIKNIFFLFKLFYEFKNKENR